MLKMSMLAFSNSYSKSLVCKLTAIPFDDALTSKFSRKSSLLCGANFSKAAMLSSESNVMSAWRFSPALPIH